MVSFKCAYSRSPRTKLSCTQNGIPADGSSNKTYCNSAHLKESNSCHGADEDYMKPSKTILKENKKVQTADALNE